MVGAEQYEPADRQVVAAVETEARSRSPGRQSSQREHQDDHAGQAFSNVESPPEDFFARDSAMSAPHVSGSGSVAGSGHDLTQGHAHSFDRSLPPPHPEAYASDNNGRPVSPIAQSQSPAHMAMHSPGEFGGSPRHFGDAVEFESSPIQPAEDGIGAMSSIHSVSPKSAARSLQQDFSEADSPIRSDRQSHPNSLGGSRDGVTNTLSFTTGGSGSRNGSGPIIHGGSGLLESRASTQNVHAFSDESSGGHEFDDDLTAIGSRVGVSSARSLGRDCGGPQRSPSSEIATQTDPPEVQVSGTYTSPAGAQRVPPTVMQEQQRHQGSMGVRRVDPRMDGHHGGGQLWMVDSDHQEGIAQVCELVMLAFLCTFLMVAPGGY
jgi:hypothetical protein